MKDWIRKNSNPPGLDKRSRGSLFSLIAKVFAIVRVDAEKAFNAFFPYLSDSKKLKEHADSLSIPKITYDTEEEFRDRVATAAFFHAKTGERGYILEQLNAHFADRYILSEEFLKVFIKIMDITDEDREWATEFFDTSLDPNIAFTAAEWFHIVETVLMTDSQGLSAARLDSDVFSGGLGCDGRFYCDQGVDIVCNGDRLCDGLWDCEGFQPERGTISDTIVSETNCSGIYPCNGAFDCSGYAEIYSPMEIEGIPLYDQEEDEFVMKLTLTPMEDSAEIDALCDGGMVCDGRNLDSILDAPMTLRIIRPFFCNGSKTLYTTTLDGAIACDGSYLCTEDGWPCTDLIEEEAV
jgi:hypothetical protein